MLAVVVFAYALVWVGPARASAKSRTLAWDSFHVWVEVPPILFSPSHMFGVFDACLAAAGVSSSWHVEALKGI